MMLLGRLRGLSATTNRMQNQNIQLFTAGFVHQKARQLKTGSV